MKTLLLGLLSAAAVCVGAAGSTAATFPTCLGEPFWRTGAHDTEASFSQSGSVPLTT